MYESKKMYFLIPLLALTLVLIAALGTAAAGGLKDIREAPWAQQAIAEMNAGGIIIGYPGGVFKPYNEVTRLEAVTTLVRVLGLEEQARAKENARVDYKMPPNLYWGRGYLITGVELGMLRGDYLNQLQPASPASRVEVAMLVYHALKLDPSGSALTFTDAGEIPADYREGVAAVVKSNLMQGLPGNFFKPNDRINRAQMAVLLARIVEYRPSEVYRARLINGTVSSVDPGNRALALREGGNKFYTADCAVFFDGAGAEPSALKAGDVVKMVLDKDGRVAFINAVRTNADQKVEKYEGRVDSLFGIGGEYWLGLSGFDGSKIIRPVAGGVKVNDAGGQRDISSLTQGSCVEIKVVDNKIAEINVLKTRTAEGRVRTAGYANLSVRDDNGSSIELDVPENVAVVKNNTAMAYVEVREGDRVKVTAYENKAVRIEVLAGGLEGRIRELDTQGTLGITIRDENGDIEEYVVDDNVRVERDGDRIDFDELDEGERVRLELDGDDRVIHIELIDSKSTSEVEGEIEKLDTSGAWGITIRDEDGDTEKYDVDDDVDVERNGKNIDFGELDKGEWVRLELNSRDIVTRIEVDEEVSGIKGKVVDLTTDSSRVVMRLIREDSGRTAQYDVAKDPVCIRDDKDIDLDEILLGAEVEVRVRDGKIDKIKMTNDEDITVEGVVTSVSASRERITIKQINGNKFTFDFAVGYVLKDKDGDRITELEDVEGDWDVELELANGEVKKMTRK